MAATRCVGKRLGTWLASHLPARLFTAPALFGLYEQRGWHITPVHYYQPIPDSRELSAALWSTYSSMSGVDLNERFQMELLHTFESLFRSEYNCFPRPAMILCGSISIRHRFARSMQKSFTA
jgi:hypothetical protein